LYKIIENTPVNILEVKIIKKNLKMYPFDAFLREKQIKMYQFDP